MGLLELPHSAYHLIPPVQLEQIRQGAHEVIRNVMNVQDTLTRIRAASITNDDEWMATIRLIHGIREELDPTKVLELQIEAAIKLWHATKKPDDTEIGVVKSLIEAMKSRTS